MQIEFSITCQNLIVDLNDFKLFLSKVCKDDSLAYRQEACILLEKLKRLESLKSQEQITIEDIETARKIFFLYNEDIRKQWIKIGDKSDAGRRKEEYQKIAKSYGEHRYPIDNGWLGLYAQEKVAEYFRERQIPFKEWKPEQNNIEQPSWENKIDDFDIKINNKTLDVKCATKPNYVLITPKVKVENEKPKDYYLATKFFDDGNLYLIGYFKHEDIITYPVHQLYGAQYYEVKIYDARCIDEFFEEIGI